MVLCSHRPFGPTNPGSSTNIVSPNQQHLRLSTHLTKLSTSASPRLLHHILSSQAEDPQGTRFVVFAGSQELTESCLPQNWGAVAARLNTLVSWLALKPNLVSRLREEDYTQGAERGQVAARQMWGSSSKILWAPGGNSSDSPLQKAAG